MFEGFTSTVGVRVDSRNEMRKITLGKYEKVSRNKWANESWRYWIMKNMSAMNSYPSLILWTRVWMKFYKKIINGLHSLPGRIAMQNLKHFQLLKCFWELHPLLKLGSSLNFEEWVLIIPIQGLAYLYALFSIPTNKEVL